MQYNFSRDSWIFAQAAKLARTRMLLMRRRAHTLNNSWQNNPAHPRSPRIYPRSSIARCLLCHFYQMTDCAFHLMYELRMRLNVQANYLKVDSDAPLAFEYFASAPPAQGINQVNLKNDKTICRSNSLIGVGVTLLWPRNTFFKVRNTISIFDLNNVMYRSIFLMGS